MADVGKSLLCLINKKSNFWGSNPGLTQARPALCHWDIMFPWLLSHYLRLKTEIPSLWFYITFMHLDSGVWGELLLWVNFLLHVQLALDKGSWCQAFPLVTLWGWMYAMIKLLWISKAGITDSCEAVLGCTRDVHWDVHRNLEGICWVQQHQTERHTELTSQAPSHPSGWKTQLETANVQMLHPSNC